MKIVLVGYMGSGKTTIGKRISKDLKISFLDLDEYIETSLGDTILNIFKEKGELFFRKKEHECLKEILEKKEDFILSTGGGTPCYFQNTEMVVQYTDNFFYLKSTIPELVDRLKKEKEERPLIKHLSDEKLPEFIGKHLFERSFYYMKAKHNILTDKKNIATIVKEITARLV